MTEPGSALPSNFADQKLSYLDVQYQARYANFGGGAVTPAVKFLLIANISVFVLQTFLDYRVVYFFGLVPQFVWQDLYLWQVFTYQFLHGGLFHLLLNMLALWMFGCDLERRWGSSFFLKYYFVSAVGGGILNTLLAPHQMVPSIGASAGVYGILLAYGLIYPNQIIYFYFLFPIKMKHFVLDHRSNCALFVNRLWAERHRPYRAFGRHAVRLFLSPWWESFRWFQALLGAATIGPNETTLSRPGRR